MPDGPGSLHPSIIWRDSHIDKNIEETIYLCWCDVCYEMVKVRASRLNKKMIHGGCKWWRFLPDED